MFIDNKKFLNKRYSILIGLVCSPIQGCPGGEELLDQPEVEGLRAAREAQDILGLLVRQVEWERRAGVAGRGPAARQDSRVTRAGRGPLAPAGVLGHLGHGEEPDPLEFAALTGLMGYQVC